MSRGKNLQEMESDTKQSRTAVNAGAKPAEPMPKLTTGIPDGQTGSWEDLGGPTPENYRSDDDSSKLKDPSTTLKQVKDVVTKGAKAAEAMKKMASPVKESSEEDEDEELVEGEYEEDDEVVAESKHKSEEDEEDEEGEESEEDEEDEEDEKEKAMKEAFAEIEEEIQEDVSALLSGEDLSEEFKDKAKLVFESALNARTQQIEEAIQYHYEQRLVEEIEFIKEELTERLDSYLEYVADEWVQENALAIDQGIKSEMTESFLQGMKSLFEEHYVTIPEEKYDVIESMVDKLDEMETKLNEQIERNVALNKRLAESVTDVIFAEVTEGLALSQKDKLASLAENVEFDSEEDYREKLVTLRESYFPRYTSAQLDNSDYISEGMEYHQEVSGSMAHYLDALGRVSKK
jgi:hypothetical protein